MLAPRGVITVAELSRRLRRSVETVTGIDWVQGEVRGLRMASSGHAYFSLRDEREEALVDCVMYRSQHFRQGRYLREGAAVQLLGRATVWAPRGRLQFIVDSVRPVGRGALLEALESLKQQLASEGLFAKERKRALPTGPRCIGVVTSGHGAAWHDVRVVALRRAAVHLVLCPCVVQGETAPLSIIRSLDLLERHPLVEAIIVGRGGGSLEDLMAFNDERVVRRIAACHVPTVSAVGHEIDTSLCDLVADARAATPSEAAEKLIPDQRARVRELAVATRRVLSAMTRRLAEDHGLHRDLRSRLRDPRFLVLDRQQYCDDLRFRMERQLKRRLNLEQLRVRRAEQSLVAQHPRAVLQRSKSRLPPLAIGLRHVMERTLATDRARIVGLTERLLALSPLSVLSRGYAIALSAGGRAITDSSELVPGDSLELRFHRGSALAQVSRTTDGSSEEKPSSPPDGFESR